MAKIIIYYNIGPDLCFVFWGVMFLYVLERMSKTVTQTYAKTKEPIC